MAGLATSLAVGWMGTLAEGQGRRERLYREVDNAANDLTDEFERYTSLLWAAAAHFEERPPASDREFHEYMTRLSIQTRYPGVLGTNLGLLLDPAEVPATVASARGDRSLRPEGNPGFQLHPALDSPPQGKLHVVRFVYPLEGNERALGYNSASNPAQRDSLDRAVATGLMSGTGPITLVQSPRDQPGLIVRMPLLHAGLPTRTAEERQRATWGILNGVWIPEAALASRMQTLSHRMAIQLVDTGWGDRPIPPTAYLGTAFREDDPNLLRRPVAFAGRMLELRFKPMPGHPALALPWRSWVLAALMALLALAGTRLIRMLSEGQDAAQALARRLKEEAEAAAEAREREFQNFFEGAPIPLAISVLAEGHILHANASWRALFEIPPETTTLGRTVDYYRDASIRPRILAQIQRTGSVRGVELPLRTQSGKELDTLFSCELIRQGDVPAVLSAFQDRTEVRRSEEALRQAQKLESMGLLAGGIAHDFNNLLSAVQGNLDLARTMPPERAAARLDAAEHAVRRATDLTRQLLAYSGRVPVQREPLDCSALVRDMATLLQVSLPKAVRLEMDLPEGLPSVIGDRVQLQQAVMNLVMNGADAIGPAGGMIHLRTACVELGPEELRGEWANQGLAPGPHLLLSVSDDGIGMDEDVRTRIFDPFFSTKEQGRGLGLSALLGILRAHHGGFSLQSQAGRGSTFTLALPSSEARPAAPLALPDPPQRFQGVAIVVDDEAEVRASAAAMLECLGFEVHGAGGGAEGLAKARVHSPVLSFVLLDLTMPPPDGRETYAALRDLHPGLPIILTSGYSIGAPGALGSDPHLGFLPKPYTLRELRAAVALRLVQES